jgi:hypothetical protein
MLYSTISSEFKGEKNRGHTLHRGLGAHAAGGDETGCEDCLWGWDVHSGFGGRMYEGLDGLFEVYEEFEGV